MLPLVRRVEEVATPLPLFREKLVRWPSLSIKVSEGGDLPSSKGREWRRWPLPPIIYCPFLSIQISEGAGHSPLRLIKESGGEGYSLSFKKML